jgi:hypothetical protein
MGADGAAGGGAGVAIVVPSARPTHPLFLGVCVDAGVAAAASSSCCRRCRDDGVEGGAGPAAGPAGAGGIIEPLRWRTAANKGFLRSDVKIPALAQCVCEVWDPVVILRRGAGKVMEKSSPWGSGDAGVCPWRLLSSAFDFACLLP